jgi:hypothetical protein
MISANACSCTGVHCGTEGVADTVGAAGTASNAGTAATATVIGAWFGVAGALGIVRTGRGASARNRG